MKEWVTIRRVDNGFTVENEKKTEVCKTAKSALKKAEAAIVVVPDRPVGFRPKGKR